MNNTLMTMNNTHTGTDDNDSRDMETLRKIQKEVLGIKSIVTEMKNACIVIDWVQSRVESMSPKISQQARPN